jgi:ABC-2 type transport system permease protein
MLSRIHEYAGTRELLVNLTLRELRSRYKKSVLGWTWSLLNPVATVAVYSIVFSVFLKIQPPTGDPSGLHSFVLFLLCALIPWNFTANTLTVSLDSLVGNANLVKKVYFPRELLVAANVAALLVTMLIELGVLCAILLAVGNMVVPWLPMLLVLVVLTTLIMYGAGLVLSVFNVYFRDVKHFVGIMLQVLFYSAPIVYPIHLVPKQSEILGVTIPVGFIYRLNPLVEIVESFRSVLYDLRFPPIASVLYLLGWAIGSVAFGMWVFSKLDRRIAEEV